MEKREPSSGLPDCCLGTHSLGPYSCREHKTFARPSKRADGKHMREHLDWKDASYPEEERAARGPYKCLQISAGWVSGGWGQALFSGAQ